MEFILSKTLSYRADIDSLRALAVLSVITFHLNHNWLSGGFLGVDIFFVISGFLITLIIHREMSSNEFSFKIFYIRRIKRILPVFFVVLFAVLIASLFFFPPNDYRFLGRSILASLLFSANLYSSIGQGYFDPAQDEKPLLHIWSLSVEEQYYFLFPLFCLWVVRRSWRVQIFCLSAMILLSAVLGFFPSFGLDKYYLPHLRAGEMFVGSLTAVIVQYCHKQNYFPLERFAMPVSIMATAVLVGCLILYYPGMSMFPGLAALLPCIATATLIYFNRFDHGFKKVFEIKWIVTIGLLSYSLYLWHWPVLAFARYAIGSSELPLSWLLPLAVIMTVLSIASYLLVEKPARQLTMSFAKNVIYFYVLPSLVIGVCWFSFRYLPIMNDYYEQGLTHDHSSCHNNLAKRCIWGDESVQPKILMVGDSHADHYKTFIDTVGKHEKWSAMLVSADSCAYVENYQARILKPGNRCDAVHQFALNHMNKYPIVILSMRWGSQITESKSIAYDPKFFEKFDVMLAKLSRDKESIYLLTDTPNLNRNGLRDYKLSNVFGIPLIPLSATPDSYKTTDEGNKKMKEIAAKYANVYVIDTISLLPDNFIHDGKPIYSDFDHINPYGGKLIAERFLKTQSFIPVIKGGD